MVARNLEYSVMIRDFLNAASDDFSPGEVLLFIDNPSNLAWTEYVNEVGEAFFTISQKDFKSSLLGSYEQKLSYRPFVEIYRGNDLVWGGWLGEIDETETDAIFYAYSYLSGFFDIVTDFDKEWVNSSVSTIVNEALTIAKTKVESRVHWIADGTIENTWTTSGGPTGILLPFYRAPYKRILSVWKEMAAYSISDTTNHVIFEVTPSGTFNFWRNRKTTKDSVMASFGYGRIRSYRRIRRPVARRNALRAVGTSPTDVNLNDTEINVSLKAAMGLSEEPIYFSFVRDSDELDRVTKARLARAARVDTDLYVSFNRNSVTPYRATNADYILGDLITITLTNGVSNITETKVVLGQQVVYTRMAENVRLLLADQL